jgi:phage tail sheath protein FI
MEASLPEYLAPGVYVEETHFARHLIEGVSTSTAAFVGLTEKGPVGAVSDPINTYGDFEQVYGGDSDLIIGGQIYTNYLAHAVRGFFENGGKRLFVVRVSPPEPHANGSLALRTNAFRSFFRDVLQTRLVAQIAPTTTYRDALKQLEDTADVSIVAAPSAAYTFDDPAAATAHLRSVHAELIFHAEKMRHRIAVLDSPPGLSPQEVATFAKTLNSSHAALYYPWLKYAALGTKNVPPSGAVCGIYARTDLQRGVWKAPANATITGISGFERDVLAAEQEMLNPVGVNVSRTISGRGLRLYGARTLSSDPEWRYVSVRRYVSYLEKSISDGIGWTVFEPNDAPLWAECKRRIEDFLLRNWHQGALQGQSVSDAFYVRCDRATMTQSDIENGRLIAQIGVAIQKPAEFHVFQINKTLSQAA